MPRNKRNPREYSETPRKRSIEKLDIVLKMLVDFHHSTRELILEHLGLAIYSHHRYFASLEKKGILRKIEAPSIRSNALYTLTLMGVELAAERLPMVINYSTDIHKINHNNLRHDLAIQKFVIKKLKDKEYEIFTAEKYLQTFNNSDEKRPDGCLEKGSLKTMLEVELTAKTDQRIFRALVAHARRLNNNQYQKVLYVFHNEVLRNYYQKRFFQSKWPSYEQDQDGKWKKENDFIPDNYPELRESFNFITDTNLISKF